MRFNTQIFPLEDLAYECNSAGKVTAINASLILALAKCCLILGKIEPRSLISFACWYEFAFRVDEISTCLKIPM